MGVPIVPREQIKPADHVMSASVGYTEFCSVIRQGARSGVRPPLRLSGSLEALRTLRAWILRAWKGLESPWRTLATGLKPALTERNYRVNLCYGSPAHFKSVGGQ